ncbi:MAG: arsenate reductase ArsC [Geminicoccaceae bacterium]
MGGARFTGYSAGSHPRAEIHPMTRRVLQKARMDDRQFQPKHWRDFAGATAPRLDFVFTLCDRVAQEPCPVWPGQPMTAHWGIEDPTQFVGDEARTLNYFYRVFTYLDRRVQLFAALPVRALNRLALQKQLEDIGRVREDASARV